MLPRRRGSWTEFLLRSCHMIDGDDPTARAREGGTEGLRTTAGQRSGTEEPPRYQGPLTKENHILGAREVHYEIARAPTEWGLLSCRTLFG